MFVTAAPRPPVERELPDVPVWALAIGMILCLAFAGLVVQTFTGRPLTGMVDRLGPGSRWEQIPDGQHRAFYTPGSTVKIGDIGIGTRGQDRPFQAGDLVLLGGGRGVVRLETDNRLTELRVIGGAPLQMVEGPSLLMVNLGAWDEALAGPSGLTARYHNGYDSGGWAIERPEVQPVGPPLHVAGAPEEELTAGFRLEPASAGRVRRLDTPAGPAVRIRPTGRAQSLVLESWEPLTGLDNVAVTVEATVRASEGASLELALNDVVDAAGTVQRTTDRRVAPNEDEWLTLRVRRRVLFASPDDRFSVGIVDVRNRDWLEVRDLSIYLGVLP